MPSPGGFRPDFNATGPCIDIMYFTYNGLQVFGFSLGLAQLSAFFLVVFWNWRLKQRASVGDEAAGRALVTPAYTLFLWCFGFVCFVMGVANVFFYEMRPYGTPTTTYAEGITFGVLGGIFHMVVDGLAVFLCMQGSGVRSLKRALAWAALTGVFVGSALTASMLVYKWAPNDPQYGFGAQLFYEVVLFVYFFLLLVVPYRYWPRRPAVTFYAACWTVYRPAYVSVIVLMWLGDDSAFCAYMALTTVLWGLTKPVVIYYTLRKDSEYWTGAVLEAYLLATPGSSNNNGNSNSRSTTALAKSSKTPSTLLSSAFIPKRRKLRKQVSEPDVRTPLLGTTIETPAAGELATQMDNLGKTCRLINFAALALGDDKVGFSKETSVMGAGGTSRVFAGRFEGKDVAVKMLYCMTLTKETVANFCAESVLLSTLRHPNVVHVEGVCIIPPSICLVMELCRGSLFELLRLDSMAELDLGARLGLAIDCASGVAYLHEQQPPVLHMDLKSSNYLVGDNRTNTWTPRDVQLWLHSSNLTEFVAAFASRGVRGKNHGSIPGLLRLKRIDVERIVGSRLAKLPSFETLLLRLGELQSLAAQHTGADGVIKLTDLELSQRGSGSGGGGGGRPTASSASVAVESTTVDIMVPQTVNWTAPEVIQAGKAAFSTMADCYSLGMVLWEVLTGAVPFDSMGPAAVADFVMDGGRPEIPGDTPPEYAALLEACWAAERTERPTARDIVQQLALLKRRCDAHRSTQLQPQQPQQPQPPLPQQPPPQQQQQPDHANGGIVAGVSPDGGGVRSSSSSSSVLVLERDPAPYATARTAPGGQPRRRLNSKAQLGSLSSLEDEPLNTSLSSLHEAVSMDAALDGGSGRVRRGKKHRHIRTKSEGSVLSAIQAARSSAGGAEVFSATVSATSTSSVSPTTTTTNTDDSMLSPRSHGSASASASTAAVTATTNRADTIPLVYHHTTNLDRERSRSQGALEDSGAAAAPEDLGEHYF